MQHITKRIAVSTVLLGMTILPILSNAAPRAMLEKAQTYALDNTFHAFRVPTVDSVNVVRYYDVKVNLVVAADGTISPNALVTRSASPNVGTINVQPGTYQETGGVDKCTVTNMVLTNGRTQSFFRCAVGTVVNNIFEFSVATGPITAGHPFLAQLTAQKINLRTDVGTQSWGLVTTNQLSIGSCYWYNPGTVVGVKTNGNLLVVNVIYWDGLGVNTACAPTMTKLP